MNLLAWMSVIISSYSPLKFNRQYYDTVLLEEPRKKIVIIDTGLKLYDEGVIPFLCKKGHRDFTGKGLNDTHGHGTNIAYIIFNQVDPNEYCLVIAKYYTHSGVGNGNVANLVNAFEHAYFLKASFVNYSGGGRDEYQPEHDAIKRLIENGTKVVVSAGNEGWDLDIECNYYPVCYGFRKNFYVVGNIDKFGKPFPSSNYGKVVKYWEHGWVKAAGTDMLGTSQSAAVLTNKIILGIVK